MGLGVGVRVVVWVWEYECGLCYWSVACVITGFDGLCVFW